MDDLTQLRRELGFLTEAEVASVLDKSVSTLQKMRSARVGPPWMKDGNTILYLRESLLAWAAAQERRTSGPDPRVLGDPISAAS